MDSPSLPPSSPSCATPLWPVSPERTNRRAPPQSPLCMSPRLRDDPFFSSPHRISDVQGRVSQFNQLTENMSPKGKQADAALRRAVLGREEAEAKMKSLEEENRDLQISVEGGRARERKIAQRVEAMMEDVQRHKESGTRAQAVYEKEIRRARKEAFKSSSAVVNLQEELKTTRNRYTLMREEVEAQKRVVESKEQESFSAQYKLVTVQEDMENLRQLLKTVEQERDILRTSLKEEEVARIAAEGRIPLPPCDKDDEFASPRKTPKQTPIRIQSESNATKYPLRAEHNETQDQSLETELGIERRLRQDAQETITFMKLECQLWTCSCRRAEQNGSSYVVDQQLDAIWSPRTHEQPSIAVEAPLQERHTTPEQSVIIHPTSKAKALIQFSPDTSTFHKFASPEKILAQTALTTMEDEGNFAPLVSETSLHLPSPFEVTFLAPPLPPMDMSESPSILSLPSRPSDECQILPSISSAPITPRPPQPALIEARTAPRELPPIGSTRTDMPKPTPEEHPGPRSAHAAPVRLVTTTTTTKIPLSDPDTAGSTPSNPPNFPFSPGATKTREEALQSIQKWREGRARARSVTTGSQTAMKRQGGKSPARRDISAPEPRAM